MRFYSIMTIFSFFLLSGLSFVFSANFSFGQSEPPISVLEETSSTSTAELSDEEALLEQEKKVIPLLWMTPSLLTPEQMSRLKIYPDDFQVREEEQDPTDSSSYKKTLSIPTPPLLLQAIFQKAALSPQVLLSPDVVISPVVPAPPVITYTYPVETFYPPVYINPYPLYAPDVIVTPPPYFVPGQPIRNMIRAVLP